MRNPIPAAALSVCLVAAGSALPAAAQSAGDGVAKIASLQNQVETRRSGVESWAASALHQALGEGDRVRTGAASRAAIFYSDQTLHRLNERSEVEILPPTDGKPGLLRVLTGSHYFSSRKPERYGRIETPTVTAAIRGTEFQVDVAPDGTTRITMLEGMVEASNQFGQLVATKGEEVTVEPGKAPVKRIVVRPRDAVAWTFYYPRILEGQDARRLETMGDVGLDLARAAELLAVGQVSGAKPLIDSARKAVPDNPVALALASVVELAADRKDQALALAETARRSDRDSAAAALALSFAAQAAFDIPRARLMAEEAMELSPEGSEALARVAEMRMAEGDIRGARDAAEAAVGRAPGEARPLSVLGFIELADLRSEAAETLFERAVAADPSFANARLGLGIARIRRGRLPEGREEIQTATILDPENALLRSYLAKAYYEEKRSDEALKELALAAELDTSDPTPRLYDAIIKQNENRPVEALRSLRESIDLNDRRGVYRSRFLLDQDRAVRGTDLARIYNDLGFEQLGLVTARRSADQDQSNYSSHMFLSGMYRTLPGFAPAFLSETLQARIYQPVSVNAVRPDSVNETVSFNEYTALFERPRARAFASVEYGMIDDDLEELCASESCQSLLDIEDSRLDRQQVTATFNRDRFAAAVSYDNFEEDGFRTNTDLKTERFRGFLMFAPTARDTIHLNVLDGEQETGDRPLRDFPLLFSPERIQTDLTNVGIGYHRIVSPTEHFALSAIYNETVQTGTLETSFFNSESEATLEGPQVEAQYVVRRGRATFVVGGGHFEGEQSLETKNDLGLPEGSLNTDDTFTNAYGYLRLRDLGPMELTLGVSMEEVVSPAGLIPPRDSGIFPAELEYTDSRVSPKLGVTILPWSGGTLRLAAYERMSPAIGRIQTLEPTQVAGFNQFYAEPGGTRSTSYGLGIDQAFGGRVFGGASALWRDLTIPEAACDSPDRFAGCAFQDATHLVKRDSDDTLYAGYLNASFGRRLAGSIEYSREEREFDFTQISANSLFEDRITTDRLRGEVRLFFPSGFFGNVRATMYDQEADQFFDTRSSERLTQEADFTLVDAQVGYRLPKRYGSVVIEARNLSDQEFAFFRSATEEILIPARTVTLRINITY